MVGLTTSLRLMLITPRSSALPSSCAMAGRAAIEMAEASGYYGKNWAFIPAAVGFGIGALFLFVLDIYYK